MLLSMKQQIFEVIFNHGELRQMLFLPEKPLKIVFKYHLKNVVLRLQNSEEALYEMDEQNSNEDVEYQDSEIQEQPEKNKGDESAPSAKRLKVAHSEYPSTTASTQENESLNSIVPHQNVLVLPADGSITVPNSNSVNQDRTFDILNQSLLQKNGTVLPSMPSIADLFSPVQVPNLPLVQISASQETSCIQHVQNKIPVIKENKLVPSETADANKIDEVQFGASEDSLSSNGGGAFDDNDQWDSDSQPSKERNEQNIEDLEEWKKKCAICLQARTPLRVLHRFPKDPYWSDKWAEKCNKKFIFAATAQQRSDMFKICSDHFKAADFDEKNYCLRANAIPSESLTKPQASGNLVSINPNSESASHEGSNRSQSKIDCVDYNTSSKDINKPNQRSSNVKVWNRDCCCVCGGYRRKFPNRGFYIFPKNPELSKKWVNAIGNPTLSKKTPEELNFSYRVCSKHFVATDFRFPGRNLLKPGACPSMFRTGGSGENCDFSEGEVDWVDYSSSEDVNEPYQKQRKKCAVCFRLKSARRRMHKFPADPDLSELWAKACDRKWIINATHEERSCRYRICGDHFKPSDYVITDRKHMLRRGSVPSRFPPKPRPVVLHKSKGEVILSNGVIYTKNLYQCPTDSVSASLDISSGLDSSFALKLKEKLKYALNKNLNEEIENQTLTQGGGVSSFSLNKNLNEETETQTLTQGEGGSTFALKLKQKLKFALNKNLNEEIETQTLTQGGGETVLQASNKVGETTAHTSNKDDERIAQSENVTQTSNIVCERVTQNSNKGRLPQVSDKEIERLQVFDKDGERLLPQPSNEYCQILSQTSNKDGGIISHASNKSSERLLETSYGGREKLPEISDEHGERLPQTSDEGSERLPETSDEHGERLLEISDEGGEGLLETSDNEGGERLPETSDDEGGERLPETSDEVDERFPETSDEGGERLPEASNEGSKRLCETSYEGSKRLCKTSDKGSERISKTSNESSGTPPHTSNKHYERLSQSSNENSKTLSQTADKAGKILPQPSNEYCERLSQTSNKDGGIISHASNKSERLAETSSKSSKALPHISVKACGEAKSNKFREKLLNILDKRREINNQNLEEGNDTLPSSLKNENEAMSRITEKLNEMLTLTFKEGDETAAQALKQESEILSSNSQKVNKKIPPTIKKIGRTIKKGKKTGPQILKKRDEMLPHILKSGNETPQMLKKINETVNQALKKAHEKLKQGNKVMLQASEIGNKTPTQVLTKGNAVHSQALITENRTLPQTTSATGNKEPPQTLTIRNKMQPQTLVTGNTTHPQRLTPGNTTHPQMSTTGNTPPPQMSTPGNTMHTQMSTPGNTTHPKMSTPGNTMHPQMSTPGNTTHPKMSTSGNTTQPQIILKKLILPQSASRGVAFVQYQNQRPPIVIRKLTLPEYINRPVRIISQENLPAQLQQTICRTLNTTGIPSLSCNKQ